jgi:uncharacterized protein (DUF2336 family)
MTTCLRSLAAMENKEKLEAIARRKSVSETVSGALVETRIESVVSTLVRNEGANISQETFEKITERHTSCIEIVGALFERRSLPVEVVEKVMERISGPMLQSLEEKYGSVIEKAQIKKALNQSLELTSLKMLGLNLFDDELTRVMNQLESSEKLSPIFALCMGNLDLFEVCMSRLLRIPLKQLHVQLRDAVSFKAYYEQVELPESMLEATTLIIDAIRQIDKESLEQNGSKQLINHSRLIDRMHQLAGARAIEGIEYYYSMLQHCARKNVRSQME